MSDFAKDKDVLISRQAAIDAIGEEPKYKGEYMSDLISRQTVIDTVYALEQKCDTRDTIDLRGMIIEAVAVLPSAEPQCKKWCGMIPNDIVIISEYDYISVSIYLDGKIVVDKEIKNLVYNIIYVGDDVNDSLRNIFPTKIIVLCIDGEIEILKGVKYDEQNT